VSAEPRADGEPQIDGLLSRLVELILVTSAAQERPGAVRLPSEREMAQRLGIQRSTLREGLATLTHLGMLRRTPGRGTFVSPPRSEFLQLYLNVALSVGNISIDDLQAVREMFEREIVRRAAHNAEPLDVFELEQLARRIERAATVEEKLEADYEFHRRLAAAAKSPLIELLMDGLSSVLRRVHHYRRTKVSAAIAAMDRHFNVWSDLSRRVDTPKSAPRRARATRAKKAS
jgi:GntR family transcriptional repressor for pyruvate dehydrogenase complex